MEVNYLKSKPVDDQQLYQKLKNYLFFFYFWGNSTVLTISEPHKKPSISKQFIKQISTILWIFITLFILVFGIFLYQDIHEIKKDSKSFMFISYLVLKYIVPLTIYLQCLIHKTVLNSVLEHFRFLDNLFRYKFQIKISIENCLRETRREFFRIFLIYVAGLFAYRVNKSFITREAVLLSFCVDALQIPMLILTMHFIFYVNIIKFMMSQLNGLMIQQREFANI